MKKTKAVKAWGLKYRGRLLRNIYSKKKYIPDSPHCQIVPVLITEIAK